MRLWARNPVNPRVQPFILGQNDTEEPKFIFHLRGKLPKGVGIVKKAGGRAPQRRNERGSSPFKQIVFLCPGLEKGIK
jgi:hypothetical protein